MVSASATLASILRCFQLSWAFAILPRIHQATITTTSAAAASAPHMKSAQSGLSMSRPAQYRVTNESHSQSFESWPMNVSKFTARLSQFQGHGAKPNRVPCGAGMDRAYDLPQNCIVVGEHSVNDPIGSVRRVPVWAQAGLLAAVYFAAAKLSLPLAIPPGYATAVWPPSGIALAATLALGNRVWPGVWIGAALVNLTVESSWLAAALIGTGNTLEALAGAVLVRRFVGAPYRLGCGEDVVKFIALSALSGTTAATVGVMPVVLGHTLSSHQVFSNWCDDSVWPKTTGITPTVAAMVALKADR